MVKQFKLTLTQLLPEWQPFLLPNWGCGFGMGIGASKAVRPISAAEAWRTSRWFQKNKFRALPWWIPRCSWAKAG